MGACMHMKERENENEGKTIGWCGFYFKPLTYSVMFKTLNIGPVYLLHCYHPFLAGAVRDDIEHVLPITVQDGVPHLGILSHIRVICFDPTHR